MEPPKETHEQQGLGQFSAIIRETLSFSQQEI
jgi:hypothetical protein